MDGFEFPAGFVVEFTRQETFGRVFCGRDAVAAGYDDEAAVALREPVRVVEDLDVVSFALGEVDRVVVIPMMVILVESASFGPAHRKIHRGVAEVIVWPYRRFEQRGDQGFVDQRIGQGTSIVPWPNEVAGRCVQVRSFLVRDGQEVIDRIR